MCSEETPINIGITVMQWTPKGERERDRPKATWWKAVKAEMNSMQHSTKTVRGRANLLLSCKTPQGNYY